MNLNFRLPFLVVYLFTLAANSAHAFKFSVFCFGRKIPMLFKTVSSMAMRFFKINSRRTITESRSVFCNCDHSKVIWVPAINSLTNMIYNFSFFKFTVNKHRKLMSTYMLSTIPYCTISLSRPSSFPQPTRIGYARFALELIQIEIIIPWQFKNTFHWSPNTRF